MQAATLYEAYGRQQQQQQQHNASASSKQRAPCMVLTPAAGPFTLQPRGWTQQAQDVTDRLLLQDAAAAAAPVHYQSAALQAEVRCAEALERAAAAGRGAGMAAAAPEDCDAAQPPPHPLVAAVCCQLLGELAELCGPLRGSLLRLRDALLPAIYSSCAAPSLPVVPGNASGSMRFDMHVNMLPWFALAGKLRADNNRLLEQQTAFTQELQQHAQHMTAVEQQLLAFQAALDAGSARAAALQSANAALEARAAAASAEAAAAVAEASALRADVARLAAELDDARDQLLASKEEHASEQEQLRNQLHAARQELVEGRQELVALAQAERQESERRAVDAEQRSEALGQQLQDAQHAHADSARSLQELQAAQAVLTPRPSAGDWGADAASLWVAAVQHSAAPAGSSAISTAQAVRQLRHQHADALAAQQRQVALLAALTAPDPPARQWLLTVEVPNVVAFLTEVDGADGDGEDGQQQRHSQEAGAAEAGAAAAAQRVRLRGLGLGRDVPRFLRCPQQALYVEAVSPQQLEQQVAALWRERASYNAAHRSGSGCSMQAFVAQHFWAQAEAVVAAAAAAAAVAAGADQLQEGQLPGTTTAPTAAPSAEAIAAAAAAASYSFYHALCSHHRRGGSAPVQHMWRVLTGQQAEEDRKREGRAEVRTRDFLGDRCTGVKLCHRPVSNDDE